MEELAEIVSYDVILRAPQAGRFPTLENIEKFRPPPEEIERCRRWFDQRGAEAHPTEFGLACRAPRRVFESLFRVQVKALKPSPGMPRFEIVGEPVLPEEIASAIEQVTIAAPPEFF